MNALRAPWLLLGLALLVACPRPPPTPDAGPPPPPRCQGYGSAEQVGKLPAALVECSGLAASRRHAGVYYAHNDDPGAGALFAIERDGTLLARLPLAGSTVADLEDVAVGPCGPGGPSCVYAADIGDNLRTRAEVVIWSAPEPAALDSSPLPAQPLRARYPDGPHDAEALVADPRTGELYVITKEPSSLGVVFRLPQATDGGVSTLERVAELADPRGEDLLTTAADLHPSGERLLLRTYGRVWELRAPGALTVGELLLAQPVEVTGAPQQQAEAVAYLADGGGYLLGSEGSQAPLYEVSCRQ